MVAHWAGLSREVALKAITINAAKVNGIDDRVGSLEVGKDADIIILSVILDHDQGNNNNNQRRSSLVPSFR